MAQELRLLRELSDNIAIHERLEKEEMYQFSRFLIETNVYELRLKEVARTEEEVDAVDRLNLPSEAAADGGALDPELPWNSLVPPHPPPEWGDECVLSLFHWAAGLRWPHRPGLGDPTNTVTFVELFIPHVVWSNALPPVTIRRAGSNMHVVARTLEGSVQSRSFEQALGTFQAVRLAVQKRHQLTFIPALPVCRPFHLRLLGHSAPQNGIPSRPWFPEASGWTVLLRDVCDIHAFSVLENFVRPESRKRPMY